MEGTHETDAEVESVDDHPVTPKRIGIAAGVMDVVVFAVLGYVVLENVAVGGIAGLGVGIGVALFLPVFLMVDEDGHLADLAPDDHGAPLREFHRVAGGIALGVGGIGLFGSGLAEVDLVLGLPAALVAASVVYLVAGFAMPNAQVGGR